MNLGEIITKLEGQRYRLLDKKRAIEKRLAMVQQEIEGLRFLGNPEARLPLPPRVSELGLQNAVRLVLERAYPIPLPPTQIRNTLTDAGLIGSSPKNLLISVHTVLTRIKSELIEIPQADGRTAYRLKDDPAGKADVPHSATNNEPSIPEQA